MRFKEAMLIDFIQSPFFYIYIYIYMTSIRKGNLKSPFHKHPANASTVERKVISKVSVGLKLSPLSTPSLVTNPAKKRSSSYQNLTTQIVSHTAVLVTVNSGSCIGHPPVPLVQALLVARMDLHHAKMVVAEP